MTQSELDRRLLAAVRDGDPDEVEWLLDLGADVEANEADGTTALIEAVMRGSLPVVRLLLVRGADPTRVVSLPAPGEDAIRRIEADLPMPLAPEAREALLMPVTQTAAGVCEEIAIARCLADAGAPPEEFEPEILRALVGANRIAPVEVSREVFEAGRGARFGRDNPEIALEPFWQAQIRSFASGYSGGRQPFLQGQSICDQPPVWSFERFGRSVTRLADGRWVLVAGEHEDHYDPDFQIYNDVTVFDGEGGVTHRLYPREVFPPTDFHSATLVGEAIILIGNLGYPEDRRPGHTQVLRLSLADFSVEPVATSGAAPGWIYRHKAVWDDGRIVVSGGKIEPGYRDFLERHALDCETWRWSRLEE